ncbi:MAG: CopG family transcriptional regulator [Candidatus Aminicenantes bacterium]
MGKKTTKIAVPTELYNKLKKPAEDAGFKAVDDYIRKVLEEKASSAGFSEEDEGKVKERLKALGYMD